MAPLLADLDRVLLIALAILLGVALLSSCWLLWRRHLQRLVLSAFGSLDEVRQVLLALPGPDRQAILLRGWMTRAQWLALLDQQAVGPCSMARATSPTSRSAKDSPTGCLTGTKNQHEGPGHQEAWATPGRMDFARSTPPNRS